MGNTVQGARLPGDSRASIVTPWRFHVTARNTRLIGLVATGALAAGVLAIPPSFADSPASGGSSGDPAFSRVSATGLPAGNGAARAAAKVAVSKNLTVLQTFNGGNDIGADGIGVAAGPGHVMQIGANGANVFVKSTGAGKTRSLNAQFGLANSIDISDPTVEYDPVGKRWVVAAVTDDGGDIGLVVRVSKKSAPNKWHAPVVYAASTSTGEPSPDAEESQVRVGITSNKVVLTAVATDTGQPTVANRILFLPKGSLFKGNEPDGWISDLNNTYDGQSPAVNATKQANAFVSVPDTDDITVTTYRTKKAGSKPTFSKSVMYPNTNLVQPPVVDQGAGDDLDLGSLTFDSAWRSGKVYAAATSLCGGFACVRVFGVSTSNGVNLVSQSSPSAAGYDMFTPSVAIDGAGNVHVAANTVKAGSIGPNLVTTTMKASNGSWTKVRVIKKGDGAYSGPGNPTDWVGGTAAALDPTAPWDAWVTGGIGGNAGLVSQVARVSLAKNIATLKVSAKEVRKGSKVKFVAKLSRPGGDTIKGLPIALTKKKGSKWPTVGKSKKTAADGKASWTLKIKGAGQYKAYGKAVKQSGGEGKVFEKVYSKAVKITLR